MNRNALSASFVAAALAFSAPAAVAYEASFSHDGTTPGKDKLFASERVLDENPDWSDEKWRSTDYDVRQEVFWDIQKELSGIDSDEIYQKAESEFVSAIFQVYPRLKDYWNDAVQFEGVRVVQSDSIIDLERVYFHDYELGARYNEHGGFLSINPEDKATESQAFNSRERMAKGQAPVGPDGQGIILCRLNDDPRASYFEMDRHLSWRLLNAISSNMTIEQACLTDEMFGHYWEDRLDRM